jgi:hypothetical protein
MDLFYNFVLPPMGEVPTTQIEQLCCGRQQRRHADLAVALNLRSSGMATACSMQAKAVVVDVVSDPPSSSVQPRASFCFYLRLVRRREPPETVVEGGAGASELAAGRVRVRVRGWGLWVAGVGFPMISGCRGRAGGDGIPVEVAGWQAAEASRAAGRAGEDIRWAVEAGA